jgi:hypothetical protein
MLTVIVVDLDFGNGKSRFIYTKRLLLITFLFMIDIAWGSARNAFPTGLHDRNAFQPIAVACSKDVISRLRTAGCLILSPYLVDFVLFKFAATAPSPVTMKIQSAGLGLLQLLQTFFYFSSILSLVQAKYATCKATPNDASWPSISQWTFLNQTLSGRLLNPLPPASACHSSYPGPNDTCAEIAAAWSKFTFHQDNPVSVAWNNLNNDSCLPDSSAPCSGLGYPVYVANVSSTNDVKLAVDFARDNNLRLNVKASGHDYLGR